MDQYIEYLSCKIIIIGDDAVGKTTTINNYVHKPSISRDYISTLGIDFHAVKHQLKNGKSTKIHFWDTGGQEKYRSLITTYYKEICGAIVMYDVTNRKSFKSVAFWLGQLDEHNTCRTHKHPILVLANKCESPLREVFPEEGKSLAEENNLIFEEINATTNFNIRKPIADFIEKIHEQFENNHCPGIKKIRKMCIEKNTKKENDSICANCLIQ